MISYTEWMAHRKTWVQGLSQEDLQAVMELVRVADAVYVPTVEGMESPSPERARAEALLWLGTRGGEGADWGVPRVAAWLLNLWPAKAERKFRAATREELD